ncbi:DUF4755 domain-containing protein [Pseudoxanthomonas winnipegensis]|uniref:hypothetical protein n=1 Tax=Pseudoxanthomonas winnipegensis TaxID=2480810 RepID=UPI002578F297|nr:hypothetical protein [Pseudoxanthomonas winnipegensis]WJI14654.1 DUF4755 domain-containing protein [Pseudoxanthomonas winnipegensis]
MTIWNLLFFFMLGAGALIALGMSKTLRTRRASVAFQEDYQRYHGYKNTDIALSTARSAIKLRSGKDVSTYAFTDVRSWEKHWHNSKHEGTLTISVRDIKSPVWTVKFGNEMEMNRWYELLGQAVNERLRL